MLFLSKSQHLQGPQKGFTLIEVIIVTAITILLMVFVITSFARSRIDLNQTASLIVADIRNAQAFAVSAHRLSDGTLRCGYGIHYTNTTSYQLYAGADASIINCTTQDRRLNAVPPDSIVSTYVLKNSGVDFYSTFSDIFFEPPDPKTYTCTVGCLTGGQCLAACSALNLAPTTITIRRKGKVCPGVDCKNINVYTSGKIEIQ